MRAVLFLFLIVPLLKAQPYDLVLHGGHVIDPANGVDAVRDVAISGNRLAAVASSIPAAQSRKNLDVHGLYVLPGLIDLHAHVFGYEGSLVPDDTALPAGTTTIVDAGGSGWRTIDGFRRSVIQRAQTRVLALINIVGAGMVGEPAESNIDDMDPAKTAATILANRDIVVGIKTAHFAKPGWTAIDRAVEAGRAARVPVMVDDKITSNAGRTSREKLLEHLRPGDIHTHMYNDRQLELIDRFTGKVQPYMQEARRRGVLLDLGHGAGSFLWPVASRAMQQGFLPDTISTDLHHSSIMVQQSDMPNCMSKMMLLGMSLPDAVLRSTMNPAKAIGHFPELGTLGVGREADVAVLDLETGVFAFKDAWGAKRLSKQRLQAVMTIRGGKVVYDRGFGASAPDRQEIYDLLLKNGRVGNERIDIAVLGKKIVRVGHDLPASHARQVVELGEYAVTGGLASTGAEADYLALRKGVTGPVAGQLREGATADIAAFAAFEVIAGRRRCVLTLRQGVIVWDSEGLSSTDWIKAGPYSNYK